MRNLRHFLVLRAKRDYTRVKNRQAAGLLVPPVKPDMRQDYGQERDVGTDEQQ
ncbi:MAG: hypothetical protein Q7J44_18050 [Pseudotabrizicola sp.]|uniref:hypothetical protein n=1 Tax=Pseudotabrizicola sp. TaxID=2939647 RepID=UPI0027290EF7|nr:hypothetical protein [Pseudotabrizicola sp.]MDO9640440.1 hypothetical protein [Pseudotabrizicola sp.]